jgi:hypothetical protein
MERYWAGLASVRLQPSTTVPGFATLEIDCGTDGPRSLRGLFVPGGPTRGLDAGVAAELFLPGDVVGRAVLGASDQGAIGIEGVLPWAGWQRLLEDDDEARERVVVSQKPGYLELKAPARITSRNWVTSEDLHLQAEQRVLLDYRAVREVLAPIGSFVSAALDIERLGLRVAAVASGPLVLGISRLAAARANAERSRHIRMFQDYDEARFWLLGS